MKKTVTMVTIISLTGLLFALPVFAQTSGTAQPTASGGLVPCGTGSATQIANDYSASNSSQQSTTNGCDFQAFVVLVKNVTNFLILLSGPIVVVIMVWAGITYMTSQGEPDKLNRIKGVLWNTIIAFIIILGGWLLVHIIASTLLNTSYNIFNV